MLFILKKFVGTLLLPLPFLLLMMGLGLLLLWCSRWQKSARVLLLLSWLSLLLLSLQPVADRLLQPLENHYSSWQGNPHVRYIVVLGGGYTWNPQWVPGSNLLNNNLPRVAEGVRLWRNNPHSILIFTGAAANGNPVSAAAAASQVAQSLGVPRSEIVILDTPKDTAQEAAAVARYLADAPFLLVTSAAHMPRAMLYFQRYGLQPVAAPANQLAINSPLNLWEQAIPAAIWLQHSERAVYEALGRMWQWLHYRKLVPEQPEDELSE